MNPSTKPGIRPEEISIVVQGPVFGGKNEPREKQLTRLCIQSLRKILPGAEIILSTWEGEEADHLPADKIVLSPDPGAIVFTSNHDKKPHNVNRQIVSTLNGLKETTRPYCFKVRSDLYFESADFLNFFHQFPARMDEWKIFKKRILVMSIFSLTSLPLKTKYKKLPFHPSDWMSFGLREDMFYLWDIPLAPDMLIARWGDIYGKYTHDPFPWCLWRFSPEQYGWLEVLKKFSGKELCRHRIDDTEENCELSERTITNNFIVLDDIQWKARSLKLTGIRQKIFSGDVYSRLMTYRKWSSNYRKYCDPAFKPPLFTKEEIFQRYLIKTSSGKPPGRAIYHWLKGTFKVLTGQKNRPPCLPKNAPGEKAPQPIRKGPVVPISGGTPHPGTSDLENIKTDFYLRSENYRRHLEEEAHQLALQGYHVRIQPSCYADRKGEQQTNWLWMEIAAQKWTLIESTFHFELGLYGIAPAETFVHIDYCRKDKLIRRMFEEKMSTHALDPNALQALFQKIRGALDNKE